MEGRMRRCGAESSPERNIVWVEPPAKQLQKGMKVPVVYYLCRNRHLEHPHFIEVPLSSPDGLFLRDVIDRLNVLRGKGMGSIYSWSCKRSYKTGFVWHDLSEDDLVLPAQGSEYILKGSELLDPLPLPDKSLHSISKKNSQDESPPTDSHHGVQDGSSSTSSSTVIIHETKPVVSPSSFPLDAPPSPAFAARESNQICGSRFAGNFSPEPAARNASSSGGNSPNATYYRVNGAGGSQDASTQTDQRKGKKKIPEPDTKTMGTSTDDELSRGAPPCHQKFPEIVQESPLLTSSSASSGCRTDTLEALIRAEASHRNSFRILEEEDLFASTGARVKPANLLLQLLTCGSLSVKDHEGIRLFPTYRPGFNQLGFPSPFYSAATALSEPEHFSDNMRALEIRLKEAEFYSGTLLERKKWREEKRGMPAPKSSTLFQKGCVEEDSDISSSTCLPQTMKMMSCKQLKHDSILSPVLDPKASSCRHDCSKLSPAPSSRSTSKRITDSCSAKGGTSSRSESFPKQQDRVIKIEERLPSGARVIIQSTSIYD